MQQIKIKNMSKKKEMLNYNIDVEIDGVTFKKVLELRDKIEKLVDSYKPKRKDIQFYEI